MRNYLVVISIFISMECAGQGFGTTATNWPVPIGGLSNPSTWGYHLTGFGDAYSYTTGSQNWSTFDINGDNEPDLVVTSEKMSSGNSTVYSPSSNPYWKVFLNTGSGFSTTATNWPIPIGGLYNPTTWGYHLSGFGDAYSYTTGSQNWSTFDINGDNKPDLVVTSEKMANGTSTVYSPSVNPYWKVFLNTGTGFSTTATNWPLPVGGLYNPTTWGYHLSGFGDAYSYTTGSQNWSTFDINGDNQPDLVVTSEKMSNGASTVYSPTGNPYWKVFLNTGTGFSTTATNWPLPVGGLYNPSTWGYHLSGFGDAYSYSIGSQNWITFDIDGDNQPDLVVTSEKMANGASTVYSPTGNPYWKVFLSTGTGFSTTATNWPLPVGGLYNPATWGYHLSGFGDANSYTTGSQNWSTFDIDGDNQPDLVVTSEKMANGVSTVYSPSGNPYWKVFLSTGTGFSITATNWSLPIGGLYNSSNWGYYLTGFGAASSYTTGSQNWSVMDINNDSQPDLIVTSENFTGSNSTVYSPGSNPYWKVYLGNSVGFAEFHNTAGLSVCPNPFSHELIINNNDKGEVILYDMVGKEILIQNIFKGETKLNTENISSGFYLLHYSDGKFNENFKVVKK